MKQTFKQIDDLARRIDDLARRIKCLCDSAHQNAHDTIYVEKAAAEDQLDAIALASLESNLCFCEDLEVCQWFAENDVKW